jgi:hypothetical protein
MEEEETKAERMAGLELELLNRLCPADRKARFSRLFDRGEWLDLEREDPEGFATAQDYLEYWMGFWDQEDVERNFTPLKSCVTCHWKWRFGRFEPGGERHCPHCGSEDVMLLGVGWEEELHEQT